MKQVLLNTLFVIIGIIIGLSVGILIISPQSQILEEKRDFIFKGNIPANSKLYREKLNSLAKAGELVYEKKTDPYSVYNREEGMLRTPEIAYSIAYIILSDIYGKDIIDKKKPLEIYLIGGKYWRISAIHKEKGFGSSEYIVLKKDDGQIQTIYGEK